MTHAPTRHPAGSATRRTDLVSLLDIASDIVGAITLLALPFAVMTPGLLALLGLSIPLLLPLVALGLLLGILSIPIAALWWLVRMTRRGGT